MSTETLPPQFVGAYYKAASWVIWLMLVSYTQGTQGIETATQLELVHSRSA